MEKPNKDTPSSAYLDHSAFTTAGVAADPEVAGIETGLAVQHVALKQHVRSLEDLEEEKQRRRAVLVRKDMGCDRLLRQFELRLYALVDKKRNDPLYRRYFEDGLRDVTEANMRTEQPEKVKTIIKSLGEDVQKPGIGPLATEFMPSLQAALAEVEAAGAALSEIEQQVAYLSDRTIPECKALWTDDYVKLHGELKVRLPRDPARVESYFYPFKKERKKPAPGDEGGDEGEG